MKSSALPALDRIASILAVRTCRLRIEGHTDNVPIHTTQWRSNWELSTARSTEMVRLLIVRYRFSPERLSAAGYAEYHPIASNDTSRAALKTAESTWSFSAGTSVHSDSSRMSAPNPPPRSAKVTPSLADES